MAFAFIWALTLLTYLLPPQAIYHNLLHAELTRNQFIFLTAATLVLTEEALFVISGEEDVQEFAHALSEVDCVECPEDPTKLSLVTTPPRHQKFPTTFSLLSENPQKNWR